MSDSNEEALNTLEAQYAVGHGVGFWIQVLRALLLLALGLSLLFIPDKTRHMLFNAMGLFWLTTGLVLIRREAHRGGNRMWLAIAILGVLTGLVVITRDVSRNFVPEVWVRGLLGTIILLTGLVHTIGVLRLGKEGRTGRPLVDLLLGVATIVLGALLILGRKEGSDHQFLYYVGTIWALLWGGLILFSAIRQWLQDRKQKQAGQGEEQSKEPPEAQSEGQPEEQTEEQPEDQTAAAPSSE